MFMGAFLIKRFLGALKEFRVVFVFLNKVWQIFNSKGKIGKVSDKKLITKLHQLIKKVNDDLDNMKILILLLQ